MDSFLCFLLLLVLYRSIALHYPIYHIPLSLFTNNLHGPSSTVHLLLQFHPQILRVLVKMCNSLPLEGTV